MARRVLAIATAVTLGVGLATKHYVGPAQEWVHNHAGAVLYVVLFTLSSALFLSLFRSPGSLPIARIAVVATLATCAVELLQLSDSEWLVAARDTRIGRLALGSNGGFDLWDFPHYLLGGVAGGVICRMLVGR